MDAQIAQGLFGPNFLLTAADPVGTPEPASTVFDSLGFAALLAGRRYLRR